MINIRFSGDISYYRIEGLLSSLRKINGETRVWIDSPGGTFEFFSVLGPPLRRMGYTSIGCDVRSAAITLHLLGHKRYALPDATFFFHEVRAITNGHGIITICDLEEALAYEREQCRCRENVEEFLRNMKNAQDWMLSFICDRTRVSKAVFLNLMRAEAILSAKEAKHYGLVHEVVSPEELLCMV